MPLHPLDDDIQSGGLSEEDGGGHVVDFEFDETLQESNIAPSSGTISSRGTAKQPSRVATEESNPDRTSLARASRSRSPPYTDSRYRDRPRASYGLDGRSQPAGRRSEGYAGARRSRSRSRSRSKSRSPVWRGHERGHGMQTSNGNDRRERSLERPREHSRGFAPVQRAQTRQDYSPPRHIHRSTAHSPPSRSSSNPVPSRSRSPLRRSADLGAGSRRTTRSPPRSNFDHSPPHQPQTHGEDASLTRSRSTGYSRHPSGGGIHGSSASGTSMDRGERQRSAGSRGVEQAPRATATATPTTMTTTTTTTLHSTTGRGRDEEGEVSSSKAVRVKPHRKDLRVCSPFSIDLNEEDGPARLFDAIGDGRIRAFIARCNYYDILVRSKRTNVWRAPEYVVDRIRKANNSGDCVFLYFSVHLTKYFQGVAMIDKARQIERPSGAERLWRVPLTWLYITDVPFYSLPHIPGLVDREGTVKESFEIPAEWNEKLIHQFSKSARWMDLEEARQSAESMEPSKSEEISG